MKNKIIEKLQKLIKHAEGAKIIGSTKEAEIFAEKVQELLDTHNLSLSDIDIETAQSSVNQSSAGLHAINQWQRLFVNNLAVINGCQMVLCGTQITLVGNEDDRLIVFEIYRYFEKLGREFADNGLKEFKKTAEYKRKRKKMYHSKLFKTSFLHGFVVALITRFRERHEEAKKASSNEQALIFIGNKLVEANRWIEQNLTLIKNKPKKVKWNKFKIDAFNKGLEAGNSVALTTKTVGTTGCLF